MLDPNTYFSYAYSELKFYLGFKAYGSDGAKLNRGLTLPRIWDSRECSNERVSLQREYALPLLCERFGDEFKAATGRELQLSDVRASFAPADEHLRAVMLDDIDDCCGAHILVETSPNNYQGHFFLSRKATEEEVMCCIRMLREYHGGDPGAAKPRQARRFATEGLSCELNLTEELVDVDFAVKHYQAEEVDFDAEEITHVALTPEETRLYREIWERKLLQTRSITKPNGDKSIADFGLATYILQKGLTADVAYAALHTARQTLITDKGAHHAERYTRTTIRNAQAALFKKSSKTLSL